MIIQTKLPVLLVNTEIRNGQNDRKFYSATFVDPSNEYQRTQISIDDEQFAKIAPLVNEYLKLEITISTSNFRNYLNLKSFEKAKQPTTATA